MGALKIKYGVFLFGIWVFSVVSIDTYARERDLNDEALIRQLAVERGQELIEASPSMDFSQPVVSRGFASDTLSRVLDKQSGQAYRQGQVAYFFGQYQRALRIWLPLAEAGFADAQASLGWMYQTGLGVDREYTVAIKWYIFAAMQGNAVAQNNLGVMFEKGILVGQDATQAIYWYRQSATQSYRFGQYNLANQLMRQAPVVNVNEITLLLRAAVDQGVKQAEQQLEKLALIQTNLTE